MRVYVDVFIPELSESLSFSLLFFFSFSLDALVLIGLAVEDSVGCVVSDEEFEVCKVLIVAGSITLLFLLKLNNDLFFSSCIA